MKHSVLVLHFGAQCPWYLWVIEQARLAADQLQGELIVKDVMEQPELAAKYRMFFPFMIIIDERIRTPSPVSAETLIKMVGENREPKTAQPMAYSQNIHKATIRPLTPETLDLIIPLCIRNVYPTADHEKQVWMRKILGISRESLSGFIAFEDDQVQAAVEYLPATLVPYPLPQKNASIAFITCIYPTRSDRDYRSPLLKRLIKHLRRRGFDEIQIIAGKRTPFPNGPAEFFLDLGFAEVQQLDHVWLAEGEEDLILMHKIL